MVVKHWPHAQRPRTADLGPRTDGCGRRSNLKIGKSLGDATVRSETDALTYTLPLIPRP